MRIFTHVDDLSLKLGSTLKELSVWKFYLELDSPGDRLVKLFEEEPLMPGVILKENQNYGGMISRRQFFEYMSRPFSLELFTERPIVNLYNFLKPEIFVLSEDTTILEATQQALQRSPQQVYEPILIKAKSGKHGILDVQQLFVAASQIHVMTLNQLQQAQERIKISEAGWQQLQQNYIQLVQNERMVALEPFVNGVAEEIQTPINFIAGNLVQATRYIQELFQLIKLYQKNYPSPEAEIQVAINQIKLTHLFEDFPKRLAGMKISSKRIQQLARSLDSFSNLDESAKKRVDIHEGIESVLLILQNRLKLSSNRNITIIKEYGKLPLVECYPGKLNLVFMCIFNYAIDALEMSKNDKNTIGKPNIRISTEILQRDRVIIRIQDNGFAMTEVAQQRILAPLFNGESIGKTTELGLSISHQIIVNKHGGQFQCISAPGVVREFTITIPVKGVN
jgi:signal transduction histidine kinase